MLGSSGVLGSDGLWVLRMRIRYDVLLLNSGIHGIAFLPGLGLSLRPGPLLSMRQCRRESNSNGLYSSVWPESVIAHSTVSEPNAAYCSHSNPSS